MNETVRKYSARDYSKPIMLKLHGKEGYRAYIKMITTPTKRYDVDAAKKKAAENLRRQGLDV